MFFKKTRTKLHVFRLIDEHVHANYKVRIMSGLGIDADKNSDAQAKGAVAEMVIEGDIDRSDVESICENYMNFRSAVIGANGGIAEWSPK